MNKRLSIFVQRTAAALCVITATVFLFGILPAEAEMVQEPTLAPYQAFLDEINEERAAAGLAPMYWSMDLEYAAGVRAAEVSTFMSHRRPDGSWWYTVNPGVVFGENLCRVTDFENIPDADYVTQLWMDSPPHRDVIMSPTITTVAVCFYTSGNGRYYFAAEFGFPME